MLKADLTLMISTGQYLYRWLIIIKVIDFASKDYQFPMKTDIFSVDFLEYTSLSKCLGSVISNKVSVFEGNRAQMTSNKSTKDQYNK